ncbi:MAG: hypothetical protein HUK02_10485, partial [Bacteroidaceae bacterium]|nr:hypothetical protein [Bacteroidaceae bacterium]
MTNKRFFTALLPLLAGALAFLTTACDSDSNEEPKPSVEGTIVKYRNHPLMADGSIDGYNEFDALETSFTKE